jgi:hypothetical protein
MGSLLKRGAIAYGVKKVVTRVQRARKPKPNNLVRIGIPAAIGTALIGGVAFLAASGRLTMPGRRSGAAAKPSP